MKKMTYEQYYFNNKSKLDFEIKIIKDVSKNIQNIKRRNEYYQKELRLLKTQFINEYTREIVNEERSRKVIL